MNFAAASSSDPSVKPPLGLCPRKLCVERRLQDIVDAIGRYDANSYIIPSEWFEEAAEICRWLEEQKKKSK